MAKGSGGGGRGGGGGGIGASVPKVAAMSNAEMAAYQRHSRLPANVDRVRSASPAEQREFLEHWHDRVKDAEKASERATTHRPSYAPTGRLTATESGTRAVLADARRDYRFWASVIGHVS